MTRGQRGRQIGRAMIALAVILMAAAAFLFIATPAFMGGGPMIGTQVLSSALYGLAVVGLIVGLVWMVRIYRSDPEPDQHAWRYRAKR